MNRVEPNWNNRTLWTGDNLDIMRGMNSESVDLIYLDPPFNSNRDYAAPVGSEAAGAAFKDTWTLSDVDEAWHGEVAEREPAIYDVILAAGTTHGKGMKAYLVMMAVRLLEMRRVLKSSGSLYLHCDPTASHYLKMLLDAVLGPSRFRNEIAWKRTSSHSDGAQGRKQYGRVRDLILFYSRDQEGWTWNPQFAPYDQSYIDRFYRHVESGTGRRYQLGDLTGPGGAAKGNPEYEVMGVTRFWRYSRERMQQLIDEGRVVQSDTGSVPRYKRYLDEMTGVPLQDLWTDIPPIGARAAERVGYPTQKPLKLLERIIVASSNEGDVVLDPFAGCATACVAAERLRRQWVGIDLSPLAAKLVKSRLEDSSTWRHVAADERQRDLYYDVHHRTDIPHRTDLGDLPNYRTHRHTLYGRQEGSCAGCGVLFPFRNMTADHIVPQSKGGSDHIDNLQLLCGACNSMKGAGSQEQFIARLKDVGLRQ